VIKKKILVVEDDNDSRLAITTMLEALGYEPIAFSGGKEALVGIASPETNLDLALLDIMMPHMNGYELLQEIKNQAKFANLPVIMVTAKDKDSDVLDGYQHGADYYITKPFTSRQLQYGIKLFLS